MALSNRVATWVNGEYAKEFSNAYNKAILNLWRPDNLSGHFVLCRSENKLSKTTKMLAKELSRKRDLPYTALAYEDYKGSMSLRQAVAHYASRTFVKTQRIEAEHLCISAGCGTVIENMAMAICEFGDCAILPAPYYSSFDRDLGMRAGVKILPVISQSTLSVQAFQKEYDRALAEGESPKVLLLTNPHNPVGFIYDPKEVEELLVWAAQRDLHVISDEIYANSIYGEDYFMSAIDLIPNLISRGLGEFVEERLHVVFGFSKDFGASGLRIGAAYTRNSSILDAWNALGYSCAISTHSQYIFTEVLQNEAFVGEMIQENKKALLHSVSTLKAALAEAEINFHDSDAGLFVWIDLRSMLQSKTWLSERALWQSLAQNKVLLTPGEFCHSAEPGFFRLCFAWVEPEALSHAVAQIKTLKTLCA